MDAVDATATWQLRRGRTLPGQCNRPMGGAVDSVDDPPATQEKCCRIRDLHLAFVAGGEIVKEHALSGGPEMKACRDATPESAADVADAAISA